MDRADETLILLKIHRTLPKFGFLNKPTNKLESCELKKILGLLIVGAVIFIEVYSAAAQNKIISVSQCTEAAFLAALNNARDNNIIQFKCDGRLQFTKVRKITQSILIDASNRKVILDGQGDTAS